jgi:hypothetical protein
MQPIFGLQQYGASPTVDDTGHDLLATPGRQAMQKPGVATSMSHYFIVNLVSRQVGPSLLLL